MKGTTDAAQDNDMPDDGNSCSEQYTLPPWRMNQIIVEVLSVLCEEDFCDAGFDYKQMVASQGIKIKRFSAFSPENIREFRKASLSLWTEGVCLVFPDVDTGATCRMIAYNDEHTAAEIMQIILHEFAHIRLRHTQQCINGELEASCFAVAMTLMIMLGRQLQLGRFLRRKEGKALFLQGIKSAMSQKEVV